MLAAAVAAMTCPLGGVLALARPAAPSGPSLVVPAPRALAALPLDGARPSCNRPPMPPPRHEVRPPPPQWTSPLALVARSMAVEWPAVGLGVREMALRTRPGCGAEEGTAPRFERPRARALSFARRRPCPPAGHLAL